MFNSKNFPYVAAAVTGLLIGSLGGTVGYALFGGHLSGMLCFIGAGWLAALVMLETKPQGWRDLFNRSNAPAVEDADGANLVTWLATIVISLAIGFNAYVVAFAIVPSLAPAVWAVGFAMIAGGIVYEWKPKTFRDLFNRKRD